MLKLVCLLWKEGKGSRGWGVVGLFVLCRVSFSGCSEGEAEEEVKALEARRKPIANFLPPQAPH
jgi:hypothetical protein